MLCW